MDRKYINMLRQKRIIDQRVYNYICGIARVKQTIKHVDSDQEELILDSDSDEGMSSTSSEDSDPFDFVEVLVTNSDGDVESV